MKCKTGNDLNSARTLSYLIFQALLNI